LQIVTEFRPSKDTLKGRLVSKSLLELVRTFCVDFVNAHDSSVCDEILAEDYTFNMGGLVMNREEYKAGVDSGNMSTFPDFRVVVRDVINCGDRVVLHCTLHGHSSRHGTSAVWDGIATFEWDGRRISCEHAEEDFYGCRHQLRSGDTVTNTPPEVVDPWSVPIIAPDREVEAAARNWLENGGLDSAVVDLDNVPEDQPKMTVERIEVRRLFAAGERVVFYAIHHGPYLGGLPNCDAHLGTTISRYFGGIADFDGGEPRCVRAVTNRMQILDQLRPRR
jgi:hypothetical protein